MKKLRKLTALLLALALVVVCVACGSSSSSSTSVDSDADGLTINVGTIDDLPGGFDPTASTGQFNTYAVMHLVYDYLFERDGDTNELYSDILEDWYYEDDTTFVMVLKDNIYFTNGEQLTGEDVLFSLESYITRESSFAGMKTQNDYENSYVSDDGLTIYLKTYEPYGPGEYATFSPILCKSWVEENGWDTEVWASAPNGSGPYTVESYVADESITLTLKEDTWDGYTSPATTMIFTHYADASTMFVDLENGVIDLALNIASADYERVLAEGSDTIAVEAALTGSQDTFCMDTTNEYLADQNVRLAIAYGVDWEAVGYATYGNLYEQPQSIVSIHSEYYDPDVTMYEYDPNYAKQLLEEAGYTDGEIELTIIGSSALGQDEMAESIQYYLDQIGITLNIEMYEMATTITYWLGLGDHDADIIIVGESNGTDPYMYLQSLMQSTEQGFPTAQVDDDYFNELADACMATTDVEERTALFYELQEYVYETALVIPGDAYSKATAYRTDVISDVAFQGYQMMPCLKYITYVGYEDMSLIGQSHD